MPEYSVAKPGDELGLGLGQVERRAVPLGERGDEEHEERDERERVVRRGTSPRRASPAP